MADLSLDPSKQSVDRTLPMRVAELANPSRFFRAANLGIPWLGGVTVLLFAVAIYRAMLAPDDYQQGATVKIMFLHVPSAWLGMLCWALMTIAALGTLVWRHPLADVTAKAAAPLGAAFTLLCLVTGSLWGRPEWGTYWVWDARLTSELILFLLYLGVIALWRTVEDASGAARAVAILTLVGAIDLPIIKFSVDWWNTLHQGTSVFRLDGSTIHPTILVPLLLMAATFTLLFMTLLLAAMRNEILRRRVRTLRLLQASAAG
jgi:heme exporter protein C